MNSTDIVIAVTSLGIAAAALLVWLVRMTSDYAVSTVPAEPDSDSESESTSTSTPDTSSGQPAWNPAWNPAWHDVTPDVPMRPRELPRTDSALGVSLPPSVAAYLFLHDQPKDGARHD